MNSASSQRGWPKLACWRYTALPGLPLLVLVVVMLALFALGLAPLFDVDEGAFAEATREMLVRGDWWHTTLQGEDRFDKPMLAYWMQGLAQQVLGPSALAARLGSALCLIGWVAGTVLFAWRYLGWPQAWLTGLMLVTSTGPLLIGRAATADALLNLLLVLTMFDLWRALDGGGRWPLRRAAVWAALGLLTKGPIALLIPAAVCALIWLLVPVLRKPVQAALTDPVAWLVLMVLALPWYGYALLRHGDAFVDGFLVRHNLERFQAPMEGHRGGFAYYLMMLPVLLMPWGGLLLMAVREAWRSWWRQTRPLLGAAWSTMSATWAYWQRVPRKPHPVAPGQRWATTQQALAQQQASQLQAPQHGWSEQALVWPWSPYPVNPLERAGAPRLSSASEAEPALSRPLAMYLASWAGFVLVFFSVSGTKLPHYVLYGVTPILLGVALSAMRSRVQYVVLSSLLGGWLWVTLMLGLMVGLPWLADAPQWVRDPMIRAWLAHAPDGVAAQQALLGGVALSGSLLMAVLWVTLRTWPRCTFGVALMRTRGLALYALLTLVPVQMYLVGVVVPWIGQVQQGPVQTVVMQMRDQLMPDDVLVMPDVNFPSLAFGLQRETPRRAPRPGEYALVRAEGQFHHPGQPAVLQVPGLVVIRRVD